MKSKGVALVCVGLDAETPSLTEAAVSLARRAQVDLRFVHVDEFLFEPWVADMPLYQFSGALIYESQEETRRQKQRGLKELLASLPKDVHASGVVLTGEIASAVSNEAETCGASLILTSYNIDKHAAAETGGCSFALRLMADASLPVLAMSRQRPLDFAKKHVSILLGDDLQPASDEATRKTFELAKFFAQTGSQVRVRQLHVHGDFREVLRDKWLELQARHPALLGAVQSPEALLIAEFTQRKELLASRGGYYRRDALAAGVVIEPDVVSGKVQENFDNAIADVDPDLVVFGRHKTLKVKPYLIGRVGLRVMLKLGRPVLVVPPFDQLYAPRELLGR